MTRVLIVEDDEDIASVLERGFQREGYDTIHAADLPGALTELDASRPDAAIVDMMLGDDNGTDFVKQLRAGGNNIPIIMLSALSRVEDRAIGLAAGADDYVVKPFEFQELVARLKVQESRNTKSSAPRFGKLNYDPQNMVVQAGKRKVALTEREAALLMFFISNHDKVVSRGEVFDTLWAGTGGTTDNVVDVYIGYLRRKLNPMSDFGIELRTVRGRGFIMTEGTAT